MSELTRPERLRAVLFDNAQNFVALAREHLSQGDWHGAFSFSTLAVGYCERYNGRKASAHRVTELTGAAFSLHTMLEGENHPGNTVVQIPRDEITESQAKTALSVAEEYWADIGLGVLTVVAQLGSGGYGTVEQLLLRNGTEIARKTLLA